MRTNRLTGLFRSLFAAFDALLNPDRLPEAGTARYTLWLQTTLIFALIPLGYVLAVLMTYHRDDPGPLWRGPELIGVVIVTLAAWVARRLNDRGHYQLASLVLIGAAAGVIFAVAVHRGDITVLHYLLLVEAVGVLFLPRRTLGVVTLGIVVATIALPLLVPGWAVNEVVIHGLGFVLFGVATMSLIVHYYQAIEHERQSRLVESEAKHRQFVEHSPLGLLVYVDNRIVYANRPALKIIGATSLQAALNLRPEDLIHPSQAHMLKLWATSLDQADPIEPIQEQVVRLDGSLCEVEAVPFRSTFEGRPSVQVLIRDITHQRHTESALYQSETRMRALLNAIPDLMFRFDRHGVFIDYKPAKMKFYAPPEQFLGRHAREVLPPHLADQICNSIDQALATGDIQMFMYQLPRDDSLGEFEARIVPSGRDEVTAIVRDVTQAQRSEEALRRRDAILEALAGASERLLQSASLDSVLPDVLARLGATVPDSRVYIFANEGEPDGQLFMVRRGEWLAGAAQAHPSSAARLAYGDDHRAWVESLSQGQVLYGLVRDRPRNERALLEAQGVISFALVPIFVGDAWWGFLGIDNCAVQHEWMPVEVEALRNLAGILGAAIVRQRAETAEREQRQLSEALRDLATTLGSTLDLDEVFSRLADIVKRLIDYETISIMLVEGSVSRSVFERGLETFGPEIDSGLRGVRFSTDSFPPLRTIVEQGEPYMIADASGPGWNWQPFVKSGWTGSYMAVPMQIEGKTVGIVNLATRRENAFTSTHAEWLRAFANQAAISMENTRLYAELSRHAEEMAVLHRGTTFLFTSLSSAAELKDMGTQIAQTVAAEFGGMDCAVFLVDRALNQCVRLGRAGNDRLRATGPIMLDQISPLAEAVQTGSLVYMPDIAPTDPVPGQSERRARSELVIPLTTAKGLIGALDLQSGEPHAFSAQDRSILTAFAERVAAVLENRQLYDEIRRYTDELEQRVKARTTDLSVRNAVAQTLSSSLDMGEMLNGVLKTAVEQLSVVGGAIYLLNSDSETLNLAVHYGISEDDLALVTGIVPDTRDLARVPQSARGEGIDIAQETGISAVMSVPIWRKDHIQGIITLVNDQPRPWRTEETHMLDAIGRQIGVALANAQLYAEAVRGEAHIRTILRSVADGLLVFDPGGDLVLMNPAAEALFAFSPAQSGGSDKAARLLMAWFQATRPATPGPVNVEFALPVDPLVGEGNSALEQCALEQCAGATRGNPAWPCWLQADWHQDANKATCPVIMRLARRSVQAHSADIRDADGTDLGTVIVLHDVTYFRELDELKGRFVSTVSHELRTPLSAILLQVSTLLKYYSRFEDGERQEMLVDIEQQAHILRELIEDILELSRFDSKRTTLQKRWINLSELYQSVLSTMRPVSDEKALSYTLSGFEDECFVEGDQHQLERVFRNLLSNAIKYTPEGGQITVDLAKVNDEIRLVVTDTGIGIAPEEQPYVFDRFFRARPAMRIASGTGLGLSIVKEIVDLHEGCIELSSELGVGSTFTVALPVGQSLHAGDVAVSLALQP